MHIVKLNGGLGNQMFQYAFALALERSCGEVALDLSWIRAETAHNGYELGALFSVGLPECDEASRAALAVVDPGIAGKLRRRLALVPKSHYISRRSGWDPDSLNPGRPTYFAGYWQSYKYYEGMEERIRSGFEFVPPLSERNRALLASAAGRSLIGVHVRRGDYLANRGYAEVCGEAYYRAALSAAAEGAADPLVLFFSDDLDWCRERLKGPGETIYVDWNRGRESYADMRLMIACDRLVIANSSFSWWGAWLGQRPGRLVVAPPKWFGGRMRDNPDIVPPEWTRMPRA
jgi:hypothetical protein